MPSKVVLWDIMGTLVHDPFRDAMPGFFGMSLAELIREKHPTAWSRFERGELSEEAFLAMFFRDGRAYDCAGFKACVREAYRWLPGMEALTAELHAGAVEMHALSNYPEWYRWIEERLAVSRYVSWSFVSCHTTYRKPEAAAFQHALTALQRPAQDMVFIDDVSLNCEAAQAAGIHAIHFTGDVQRVREELRKVGLPL